MPPRAESQLLSSHPSTSFHGGKDKFKAHDQREESDDLFDEDVLDTLDRLVLYLSDKPKPKPERKKLPPPPHSSTALLDFLAGAPPNTQNVFDIPPDALASLPPPPPPPQQMTTTTQPFPASNDGLDYLFPSTTSIIPPPPLPSTGADFVIDIGNATNNQISNANQLLNSLLGPPPPPPPQQNPPPSQPTVIFDSTPLYDSVFITMSQQLNADLGIPTVTLMNHLNNALDAYSISHPNKSMSWKVWASEKSAWCFFYANHFKKNLFPGVKPTS